MNRDLTMLLGIEARMKGLELVEKFDQTIKNVRTHFEEAGAAAAGAGDKLTQSFNTPKISADLLSAANQRVALSLEQVQTAADNLAIATKNAATGEVEARNEQIAAANAYKIALGQLTAAEYAAIDAEKAHKAAMEKEAVTADIAAGASKTFATSLDKWGPKAAIATAVLGGIAFSAAHAAVKYAELGVKIANSANISDKAGQDIANAFLNMSTESKFSGDQISTAYSQVAGQLGTIRGRALSTAEAVDFMNVAQKGAAASGQSLSSVTSGLAKIMQQNHLSTSQAATAETALYNLSRLTGMGMQQLTMRVSMMTSQLGIFAPSISDVSALMLDLTEHHVNARRASMMLSSAMNTLLRQGHATTPTLKELNDAAAKLPATLQPYAKALLTGKMTLADFQKHVKSMGGTLKGTAEAGYLSTFGKLATQAAADAGTLNALKLTPAQEEMSHLGISAFDAHGKFVGLKSIISQLAPKLREMKTEQERLNAAQILFGGQAKTLLPTLLAGKNGIDKATKAIEDQKAMEEAAQRAQNTYEANVQKLHNSFKALQISLGNAFIPVLERLMQAILKILKPITTFVESHKKLVGVIFGAVTALGIFITTMWALHKVATVTRLAFTTFSNALLGLGKGVWKVITWLSELITGETAAGVAAEGASVGFWSMAASIWATIWPILAVIAAIALIGFAVYELLKHWNTVWNAIISFFKWVGKEIARIVGDIVGFFIALPGEIISALASLGSMLWNVAVDAMKWMWHGITSIATHIFNFFMSLPEKILSFLVSLPSKMWNFGVHLIESIIHGVGSMAGKLGSTFVNLIKGIPVIGGLLSKGMNIVSDVFHIFHAGGVVPGHHGQEVPAILQAGETVLTPQQMRTFANRNVVAGASMLANRSASTSGQMTVINVHVNGQVYGSMTELANALGRHLNTQVLPRAGVVLKR